MNCGLCTKELEIIQEILSRYETVQSAVLFGSRVKGNFKTASDVDIALKGAITIKLIAKIKADFEDSNLPFFVDIVDYVKADNALKNEIDTQGVMLYPHFKASTNTWQRVGLGEVGTIITGKTPSYNNPQDWGHSMLFITPTDYKHYHKYASDSVRKISDTGLKRFAKIVLPKNSILVTCIGSDMGKVIINKSEAITNQQINSIVPNKKINYDFLYYSMVNMRPILKIFGSDGTAVPILNKSDFENLTIPLPPLEIQNQIASILSSFDDKIDLLHRQNKTLESLALTLFRHTFINNPNRDEWEEKPLSEIAEIQNGFAFKNSDYIEQNVSTYEVLKMGHIESGGGLRYSPKAHYVKSNDKITKWILNEDDIVLAMTDMKDSLGILGYPAMVDKSNYYVLNQRVARMYIKCKEILVHNYLLFLFLKENVQELQALANGGVQVNLSTEAIKNFKFVIPPIKFQTQYLEFFMRILNKYKNNRRQIQSLQQTRDVILVKIFSERMEELI